MIYRNGKEILPAELLREIQQYVQGELIYIPKPETSRAGWGERNGTREILRSRNTEICSLYWSGSPVAELIDRFHLSEDSVKKIISHSRRQ
ncbi:MAG TPA: CD3324 family protein [Bacillota bacterium]